MNEKKDQNNEVVVTTAEQLPQEDKPKKVNIFIRAGRCVHKKYLQFKATPVGRWVVRGGKVAEGALAVYGLYELFGKKPEESEAVITCGEIVDESEMESVGEEPVEDEVIEEHE